MKIQKIENLLISISAISKKYEKIAETTGENFNIFNILRVSTREVRTHSAFLAELLNPNGAHGLGTVFLKLFMDGTIGNIIEKNNQKGGKCFTRKGFVSEDVQIEVEKYIGKISDDKTEGGYIDIVARNTRNKQSVIIENKIYADDQENQLLRYSNYGKKSGDSEFVLLYLTLNGKPPSDKSLGDKEKVNYVCISYSHEIKPWLEKCKEKAVNHPLLRETIAQYIYLINQLTGQTMKDEEKTEVAKMIIKNDDTLETTFKILESNILLTIKETIFTDIITKTVTNAGFDTSDFTLKSTNTAFKKLLNNYKLIVSFREYLDYFIVGIEYPKERISDTEKLIEEKFNELDIGIKEEWEGWGCVYRPDDFDRWNLSAPWLAVKKGEFGQFIKKIVEQFEDLTMK